MPRRQLAWIAFALAVLAAIGLFLVLTREPEPDPREADARAAAAADRREADWTALAEESRRLLPPQFDGVELGMRRDAVQALRPGLRANPDSTTNDDAPGIVFLEEVLPNGSRALFGFEEESQRLQRLQVLSLLPTVDAIAPHLTAMNDTYGPPTGIWHCPDTGGVPTRRFTWRHGRSTVMDIFLVYGGRVSVTLYIAPSQVVFASLTRGGCRPVRDRDEAAAFPVATPEQMMGNAPSGAR